MDLIAQIAQELGIRHHQVESTVKLLDEGNTVPFIARYRKEATDSLDDTLLRKLSARLDYLRALLEKKEDVLRRIAEQGKLNEEIKSAIEKAVTLQEVEDIYRPYRPKKRTRATIAKERGLEPLALLIWEQTLSLAQIEQKAKGFISMEKGVENSSGAIAGALDIVAEMIADDASIRTMLRRLAFQSGMVTVRQAKEEDSVYHMYYGFEEPIGKIANHRILAIDRGEREGFLNVKMVVDEAQAKVLICRKVVMPGRSDGISLVEQAAGDAYTRLIAPSAEREIRSMLSARAQENAIELFSKNLRQLLLQPPIGGKTVLALDPGFRTGCKLAVVDPSGGLLEVGVIYCTLEHHDKKKAMEQLLEKIHRHKVDIIAIGNGTASRETEVFAVQAISMAQREVKYIIVSEAGASVYSASEVGAAEFPDYDVSLRSAVSIARRLEDPLSELVKIDPKAIGVGQYQHDVNQKQLGGALQGVVEDCVNSVGVNLNTASAHLLSFVAGIGPATAKNIISYREKNGIFTGRNQLKKVSKLGEKAFIQCAGFLRILESKNVLDRSAVHPESYALAQALLSLCGYTLKDMEAGRIADLRERATSADLETLAKNFQTGLPTITDIIEELLKPGRDFRAQLPAPVLMSELLSMESLKPGMVLDGTVRNVTDFGAFVDIGIHQDGLVHISQICSRFIRHPIDILSVGDVVRVKIVDIDVKRARISLTMRDIDDCICNLNN